MRLTNALLYILACVGHHWAPIPDVFEPPNILLMVCDLKSGLSWPILGLLGWDWAHWKAIGALFPTNRYGVVNSAVKL